MTVDSQPAKCLDGTMNEPLREMRNQVYEQRSTDHEWMNCFEHWILDEDWLRAQYQKLPRPLPPYENLPWPKTT